MHISKLKTALDIFIKYEDSSVQTEHDQLFVCETFPEDMDPQDVKILEEDNWMWDKSLRCWWHFT